MVNNIIFKHALTFRLFWKRPLKLEIAAAYFQLLEPCRKYIKINSIFAIPINLV